MLRRTFIALSSVLLLAALPAQSFAQDTRLNPNTASAAQLESVPGLDASLAAQIVAGRPFATMVEFDAVVGATLAPDAASAVYEQVFIPINLNTASNEEIALIPGMSRRMVREFLEYRPYADLSEFDREIGKYVDDAEVARLRSYVTL